MNFINVKMKKLVLYFSLINCDRILPEHTCSGLPIDKICYNRLETVGLSPPGGKDVSLQDVKGGFSPIGNRETLPCPNGTFPYKNGLSYPWQCKDCPPGVYCNGGKIFLCSDGQTSKKGAKTALDCFPCPNGYHCSPGKPKNICPVGQKRMSVYQGSKPYKLEIGNFSTDLCDDQNNKCTVGWFEYSCEECPAGWYCQAGAVDEVCFKTYSLIQVINFKDGGVYANESFDILPKKCHEGTYNSFVGQAKCLPCNIGLGEYCPTGSTYKRDSFPARD